MLEIKTKMSQTYIIIAHRTDQFQEGDKKKYEILESMKIWWDFYVMSLGTGGP